MTNTQSIGVMVIEEFIGTNLFSRDFVHAVCPHQERPSRVDVRWRDSSQRIWEEIPLRYCSTELQANAVHLFATPGALGIDFSLSDLQFPMDLQGFGFVVIVDLNYLHDILQSKDSQEIALSTEVRDPGRSGLVWALGHEMPFAVVAYTPHEPVAYSTEELRSVFELSAEVPIYHCSSDFDSQVVHEVLSILLGQFGIP